MSFWRDNLHEFLEGLFGGTTYMRDYPEGQSSAETFH